MDKLAQKRDYSVDMKTINAKIQSNGAEDLYEIMPCGHKRRYLLNETCLVCLMKRQDNELQMLSDLSRELSNYDLD